MKILVVEDERTTAFRFERMLKQLGYEPVLVHTLDEFFLAFNDANCPKVMLLDWNLPEVNGADILTFLEGKENSLVKLEFNKKINRREFYVIVVTADPTIEAAEVLDLGADDFIAKPIALETLRTRLKSGCRIVEGQHAIKEYSRELEQHATRMEELARSRAEQLIHAEKMSSLGIMAAGVAHEINNPTTFISGNAAILQEFWPHIEELLKENLKEKDDPRLKFIYDELPKSLKAIQGGVQRIRTIVDGLRLYARRDSVRSEFSVLDLNHCVSNALKMCAHLLQRISVDLCFFEALPKIKGHSIQIEQVLVNLITNAVQAMEKSSRQILKIQTGTDDVLGRSFVHIIDSGPGVEPHLREKIFDPFFTTKGADRGTGLGLSICKSIIKEHHGDVLVHNNVFLGAVFEVWFPICFEKRTNEGDAHALVDC